MPQIFQATHPIGAIIIVRETDETVIKNGTDAFSDMRLNSHKNLALRPGILRR